MPEYLAPGVYVEEVDTGSKPIEGVSTSTAGMVGVTERGPVNVPILVTGMGEYTRWFGERLNILNYPDGPAGATAPHCYLPYAVEGFFTNGGKRLYVTRVIDEAGATRATFDLHDRGTLGGPNASAWSMLLRSAGELTGAAGSPIYVLNTNAPVAVPGSGALAAGARIRIGTGSDAEYREVAAAPGTAVHVALNLALSRSHADASPVNDIARTPAGGANAFELSEAAAAGTAAVILTAPGIGAVNPADLPGDSLLEIGSGPLAEYVFLLGPAVTIDTDHVRVVLRSPLARAFPAAEDVAKLDPAVAGPPAGTLDGAAQVGDRVVFLAALGAGFVARDHLIIFEPGVADRQEVRRIGDLGLLALATPTFVAYPAGSLVEGATLVDSGLAVKHLTARLVAGSTVLALDNRTGLAVGGVLAIGAAPDQEYATITALPNPSPGGAAPNAGNVVLSHAVTLARPNATQVHQQNAPVVMANRPATVIVLDAPAGSSLLALADAGTANPAGEAYLAGDVVRITTADGGSAYYVLAQNAEAMNARPVELNVPLVHSHPAGAGVMGRQPLLNVQALDAGQWGNRLRVAVEEESPGLVAQTTLATVISATRFRLASAAGVEAGTLLEFSDANDNPVDTPVKVAGIDRATNDITLDAPGLTAAQQVVGLRVRSREFRITVYLLRQPDPAVPSRNDTVLNLEVFRYLSMDPRHSRYVQNVIGDINGPRRASDHRQEGESWYVRIHDPANELLEPPAPAPTRTATLHSVRPGPEALVDVLPNGTLRAARLPLTGGDDSLATLTDTMYLGTDDPTPENRTGLYTLRNVEDISIIACPGRTSSTIQGALIDQCEAMRYRFCVLDGPRAPADTVTDVQLQRQQFDTKYAGLYYPWLIIPDPYPVTAVRVADFPIPPSGHVIGIYARTDIQRGVHKAPANEVVAGITGLRRLLNKEQQDILNPYPVNINVIRDFRNNNRGIRVYGGRVITSDSDWKYVNVRRLLIFIEASIDRGLQWVVFEPNAEPLWARVRRSIANFLTLVWRNGALEGTKPEEAFYVKCDRTTMTQTDIDSGRLICLIGVAPVKPAEFVIIRIGLWTARSDQ